MTALQSERDFKYESLHVHFEKLSFETLLPNLSPMGLVLKEAGAMVLYVLIGKSLVQGLLKLMVVVHIEFQHLHQQKISGWKTSELSNLIVTVHLLK